MIAIPPYTRMTADAGSSQESRDPSSPLPRRETAPRRENDSVRGGSADAGYVAGLKGKNEP